MSRCPRPHHRLKTSARKIVLAWTAILAAGCQPSNWNPPPAQPPGPVIGVRIDPCEERLHDVVCEQLMIYYAIHKELPPTLEDLRKVDPTKPLECPVSGKPYVYNPQGLEVSGWTGRLIVYDSEPIHDGHRWGIVADLPRPGKPFAVRVARPPEGAIRPPRPPLVPTQQP